MSNIRFPFWQEARKLLVDMRDGNYYIRLINTDGAAATGVFRARWEERP